MDEIVLDTDILSEILKGKNPQALSKAQQYLAEHGRFAFSAVTFYEVTRGLRASGATRALDRFLKLAADCDVLPISLSVLIRAADLWADAYRLGYSLRSNAKW